MATTTSINALRIPQSADTPDVVRDVTNLGNDVDQYLGAWVCTSTTHPSSPKPAQRFIFETDTLRLLYWNGTSYIAMTKGEHIYSSAGTSPAFSGATYQSFNIDITAGGFTSAPNVVAGLTNGPSFASTAPAISVWVVSVTSTTVTVGVKSASALAGSTTVGVYIVCSGN